jgi:hypothetical protein
MKDFIAVGSPRGSHVHARIVAFLAIFSGLLAATMMALPG